MNVFQSTFCLYKNSLYEGHHAILGSIFHQNSFIFLCATDELLLLSAL